MDKRLVHFDEDLGIEAYRFQGIMQRFPNHFHEHYVIGFVDRGSRRLTCSDKIFEIGPGDIVLLQPLQNHCCEQIDQVPLDWRSLNISCPRMEEITEEITGRRSLPEFSRIVVPRSEMVAGLRELHDMALEGQKELEKEELLYFFMEQLIAEYTQRAAGPDVPPGTEVRRTCEYMEAHYMDAVTLADLSRVSGLKKYTLLRHFTVERGITPYQYLSALRVNKAKGLLEAGEELIDVAMRTGFSDQSHFTRFFKSFIGVTPKVYQNMFRQREQ